MVSNVHQSVTLSLQTPKVADLCVMYTSVCVVNVFLGICVCVCVYVNLSYALQSAQTDIIFTLLSELHSFFLSFDIYLQAENHGLPYCMFSFHLFLLTLGREKEEKPK